MSALQRRLVEFFDIELQHSLGSYRGAREKLVLLREALKQDEQLAPELQGEEARDPSGNFLIDIVEAMRAYNHLLDEQHDGVGKADLPRGHPTPTSATVDSLGELRTVNWPVSFYCAVRDAIASTSDEVEDPLALLRRAVMAPRANLNQSELPNDDPGQLARDRRDERFGRRLDGLRASGWSNSAGKGDGFEIAEKIVSSHLAKTGLPLEALPIAVVRAFAYAHLLLHQAEALASGPLDGDFGDDAEEARSDAKRRIQKSMQLNTFVWAAVRTAPWIFAEDDRERSYILKYYGRAWRTQTPVRAMWIGSQISLLALYRRAYGSALLGQHVAAYRDYHKLQLHLRDTLRRIDRASVHVEGAIEFLDSLDALADFHIGELYRADQDHPSAITHFHRAYDRLERLAEHHDELLIRTSRWFVHLQLSLGKASYELGRHKPALAWYLRAWRTLLRLTAADFGGETSTRRIDDALAWLDRVAEEPNLHKRDLIERLGPVVDQIDSFRVESRLTLLASEILLRLGHLIFVFNLQDQRPEAKGTDDSAPPRWRDSGLAALCVGRAWQLDNKSTLAIADLLKIEHRVSPGRQAPLSRPTRALDRDPIPVREQWPGGPSRDDSLARTIEYVFLRQMRGAETDLPEEGRLARELLYSLLMHTDTIEARKAQIYERLSHPATPSEPVAGDHGHIEFICMRRYSSAFPILPRPQAFSAEGGGYFVRLCPGGGDGPAFGIAIDPGTSFVETLYRAGYSVTDIDMIFVSHDHVDHASSFEPLRSLLYESGSLTDNRRPLVVAGNASADDRWRPMCERAGQRFFSLASDDLGELGRLIEKRIEELDTTRRPDVEPAKVKITALCSCLPGTKGHRDLLGNPSIGLIVSIRGASASPQTLAITSDLPNIPDDVDWPPEWQRALAADVLVCHVSSTPIAELRKIGRLPTPHGSLSEDVAWINAIYGRNADVRARLNYAHWLTGTPQVGPVGDAEAWQAPLDHPYLHGMVNLARAFRDGRRADDEVDRLFVIGELSEELGSFRGKLAIQLNKTVFDRTRCRGLTADMGLRIAVVDTDESPVRVLCSSCELDNDLAPIERFHDPPMITGLCVKGENEGTFYTCREHDPMTNPDDPIFVERHERYDVFGR
jgi:tetratricopeptide (TPR) repeat protein